MGDRYYLTNIKCPYCGYIQLDEVYYASTCNIMTYNCEKCEKEFFINIDFDPIKVEDVTYEDVENAIENSSNMMDLETIKSCAKGYFEQLNSKIKEKEND